MTVKLVKLFNDLRASYWFVPMCMGVGAVILAIALRLLDASSLASRLPAIPWVKIGGPEDARTILGLIATGVLGVAGVVFSITIVAVSFASSNFGPRLIGNFMRDRGSQFTLGTFIGTFVYCLLILSNLHSESTGLTPAGQSFVPYYSITLALLFMLASISVLIYFIHHIAETINIENIISAIGLRLQDSINDVYPGTEPAEELLENDFASMINGKQQHDLAADCIGYVEAISHDTLAGIATDNDLLISVHYRPGDFVSSHDCLMTVWCDSDEVPRSELSQCFATGQQRTEHQNVLFLVEQLGEVIARALSPGVNDPFTAISCLNWYKTALSEYLARHKVPVDDHQWHRRRIQLLPVTFERLTGVMFDRTRQYITGDNNVVLHTLGLLTECACQAGSGPQQDKLVFHLDSLYLAALENLGDGQASHMLTQRYMEAKRIVKQGMPPGLARQEIDWFGGSA